MAYPTEGIAAQQHLRNMSSGAPSSHPGADFGSPLYSTQPAHLSQQPHQYALYNGDHQFESQPPQYNASDFLHASDLDWATPQQQQHLQQQLHQQHQQQEGMQIAAQRRLQEFQQQQRLQQQHQQNQQAQQFHPAPVATEQFTTSMNQFMDGQGAVQNQNQGMGAGTQSNSFSSNADEYPYGNAIAGCPGLRILSTSHIPQDLYGKISCDLCLARRSSDFIVDAIMSGGHASEEQSPTEVSEVSHKKLKTDPEDAPSPKRVVPQVVPQPAAQPQSTAASRSKVPTELIPRMRYLLQQCLEDEEEDPSETAAKAWSYVSDVQTDNPEAISAAATTILRYVDDESSECMGKIVQFSVRLRKWIVAEHNKDKKSPLIPKLLKVRDESI